MSLVAVAVPEALANTKGKNGAGVWITSAPVLLRTNEKAPAAYVSGLYACERPRRTPKSWVTLSPLVIVPESRATGRNRPGMKTGFIGSGMGQSTLTQLHSRSRSMHYERAALLRGYSGGM
jgi:hypothetical protein